jgi:hypothetical protein
VESIDDCSLSGEENDGLYFFEWSERNGVIRCGGLLTQWK